MITARRRWPSRSREKEGGEGEGEGINISLLISHPTEAETSLKEKSMKKTARKE